MSGFVTPEPEPPPLIPVVKPKKALWRRMVRWFLYSLAGLLVLLLLGAGFLYWAWTSGRMTKMFLQRGAADSEKKAPQERAWPAAGQEPPDQWTGPRLDASQVGQASEIFATTNLWQVHLKLTADQWKTMEPESIRPNMSFNEPDGAFPLVNTNAVRNGLAGVLGIQFPWSSGQVEFGGLSFTNVGVRIKGNGTFLGAYVIHKKPFKVDLNKNDKAQKLAGVSTLNFGNLNADFSGVSDAMAYEFFRGAGVPAPRTAYARMLLTIQGECNRRPLGLYVMVENPDAHWAKEAFGSKQVAVFKPVTYELLSDLGANWSAYDRIYDPKTKITDEDKKRVMEVAHFVSHLSDEEFAKSIGDLFDVPEVARFIAVNSLLSSYDGFLNNGQNFLMYLDARSGRVGFIPWDLDRAWGEFGFIGKTEEREQASIMHPWVGKNRLMERLFAVESFRNTYRVEVQKLLDTQFDPDRLSRRLDELAAIIKPAVDEESDYRRERFREATTSDWSKTPRDGAVDDPFRPVHQIKRFVHKRAESVRLQLAGKSEGVVFKTRNPPEPPKTSKAK